MPVPFPGSKSISALQAYSIVKSMATIFHTRMLTEAYRKKAPSLRRSGRIFRSCLFIPRLPTFRRSFLSSHKKKEELMNTRANIRPGVPLAGFLSSARRLDPYFQKKDGKTLLRRSSALISSERNIRFPCALLLRPKISTSGTTPAPAELCSVTGSSPAADKKEEGFLLPPFLCHDFQRCSGRG